MTTTKTTTTKNKPSGLKLPFKTPPKPPTLITLGTEETGTIEIPQKGYLTIGESSTWELQVKRQMTTTLELYKVAGTIAKGKGIDIVDAVELIQQSPDDLWLEFPEALETISKTQVSPLDIALEKATTLIASRLVPEFTKEDAEQLPEQLITQLAEFGDAEKAALPYPAPQEEQESPE